MKRDNLILAAAVAAIGGFGWMWVGSTTTLAAPLEPVTLETIEAIKYAKQDVAAFFKTLGYTGEFTVLSATRDESLNRRYYRVRVGAENIVTLRQQAAKQWTWGRFNRAVYQNNVSARIPRSANTPAWWRNLDDANASRMMLDHGGSPNWYLVFNPSGEVGLMWTGK